MSRHTHPTEPRRAEVVDFPLVLAHWPLDAVARSVLAPLPSCAGVLIWRPARSALFWVQTDEDGHIVEAWPVRYAATEHRVVADAQHRPCFQYEERSPTPPPKRRKRRAA